MKHSLLIFTSLLLIVSGCRLGPSYTTPTVCAPEEWKAPVPSITAAPRYTNWWEVFQDNTLNDLEAQAIANNPTLAIAIQRIVLARAMVKESGSALYPQITLNPAYTNTEQLFKIFLPPGFSLGAAAPGVAIPTIPSVYRIHQFQYFLPLVVNYELDLWGKLRSQYDSSIYSYQASLWDYQSSLLTLTTDLASTYFQLRSQDGQINILEATLKLRKKELHLASSRFKNGLVTRQDVASAEVQVANAESLLIDAQRQRGLFEDMIGTLLGMPASLFCLNSNPLSMPPPEIPAGLPTDILLQRPDLAEAERQSAAEHALIGAAYASFFPSLSLSGVLGFSSPTLKDFLKWKSRYWQIGANSSQMVFDGGYDEGNLEVAWANFRQASLTYQKTVLTAFQEAEDALNDIEYRARQYDTLERAVKAARENLDIAIRRYTQGLVYYQLIVDSDRSKLDAELSLMNTLGARYVSTVQFIKAIGGTWRTSEIMPMCATP